MSELRDRKEDVPPLVALVGLGGVLLGLLYMESPVDILFWKQQSIRWIEFHPQMLGMICLSCTFNSLCIASFTSGIMGFNRQGKRLALLAKKCGQDTEHQLLPWKILTSSLALGFLSLSCLSVSHWPGAAILYPLHISKPWIDRFAPFIRLNVALSIAFTAFIAQRSFSDQRGLPRFLVNSHPFHKEVLCWESI